VQQIYHILYDSSRLYKVFHTELIPIYQITRRHIPDMILLSLRLYVDSHYSHYIVIYKPIVGRII